MKYPMFLILICDFKKFLVLQRNFFKYNGQKKIF